MPSHVQSILKIDFSAMTHHYSVQDGIIRGSHLSELCL